MALKAVFLGSKPLGLSVVQALYGVSEISLEAVITIDDTSDARTALSDYEAFSTGESIPLHIISKPKDAESIILKYKPDICVVVGWYWRISSKVLKDIPFVVGVHNSLLPKYRGFSPLVWQLINGEAEVGYSVFSITEKIDEGAIWASGTVPVDECDYVGDILSKLNDKTVDSIRQVIQGISRGNLKPVPQLSSGVSYGSKRIPEDGLINWNRTAREVLNLIRALSHPYPGAFSFLDKQKVHIRRARIATDALYYGEPGQVARLEGSEVYVVCGDQRAIVIEEMGIKNMTPTQGQCIKSINTRLDSIGN